MLLVLRISRQRNWGEILAGTYQYDRNLQEAQATKELNKEMLVKVWKRVVAEGGSDRRVLTSQVLYADVCRRMLTYTNVC